MQQFDNTVNQYLSFLDNEYVSTGLSLFLVLYAGMAAPQLPENVARLFENTFFKVLIFFLIVYTSRRNPTVAIISAVALMVSLQTLSKYDTNRKLMEIVDQEEMTLSEQSQHLPVELPPQRPQITPEQHMNSQEVMPESLTELEGDVQSQCSHSQNYRDSFYPQYVEAKGHQRARNEQEPVAGFDVAQNYASLS
ncbi:MAG: hypothetical protein CMF62_00955 [Magnetococcales bacterium]|nr:hypothetical protein [Magnetococcales bacterium]|tara:strand:- start:23145 stop:23726 length:582 start_codon:yes stop_codon:yes gene_type:complete